MAPDKYHVQDPPAAQFHPYAGLVGQTLYQQTQLRLEANQKTWAAAFLESKL